MQNANTNTGSLCVMRFTKLNLTPSLRMPVSQPIIILPHVTNEPVYLGRQIQSFSFRILEINFRRESQCLDKVCQEYVKTTAEFRYDSKSVVIDILDVCMTEA